MVSNVEDIVKEFEDKLLDLLLNKLVNYPKGEFIIKEVFAKEWRRIPSSSTGKNIGRKFAEKVKQGRVPDVKFLYTDTSNTSRYEKL